MSIRTSSLPLAALVDAAPTGRVECAAVEVDIEWSFEDFFRREYPTLVAVGTALVCDRHDAEDLAQDSMVKAFTRWSRVGRLDRPGAWCHRVLIHAIRSRWRRRVTQRRYLARLRREEAVSAGPAPDVVAFWDAVRGLPTRPRAAVAFHFAADLTMADVAAVLGVPEGTVRSDIARARAYVMARLEDRS